MSARLALIGHGRTRVRAWFVGVLLVLSQFGEVPARAQQNCPEPSGTGIVESYCYDALGRLIEQRRSDSASATITYDDAGNRTTRTQTAGTAGLVVVIIGGRPFVIVVP